MQPSSLRGLMRSRHCWRCSVRHSSRSCDFDWKQQIDHFAAARLTQWFGDTTNGIKSFLAERVQTKELCVDDVASRATNSLRCSEEGSQQPPASQLRRPGHQAAHPRRLQRKTRTPPPLPHRSATKNKPLLVVSRQTTDHRKRSGTTTTRVRTRRAIPRPSQSIRARARIVSIGGTYGGQRPSAIRGSGSSQRQWDFGTHQRQPAR